MRLNVNPNRMELIKLRRRLTLARRGHKLLKDKRDELMRIFMEMFARVFAERIAFEKDYLRSLTAFALARASMPRAEEYAAALAPSEIRPFFSSSVKTILSVKVPDYSVSIEGDTISWSRAAAPPLLDESFESFRELLPRLLRLFSDEKTLELLAAEVERTRRRVNALEYVLIPNLAETIRYISMRLSENERSEQVRLMKVKDIVRSH